MSDEAQVVDSSNIPFDLWGHAVLATARAFAKPFFQHDSFASAESAFTVTGNHSLNSAIATDLRKGPGNVYFVWTMTHGPATTCGFRPDYPEHRKVPNLITKTLHNTSGS